MQNKKILIITYYWPPSGGAGVQRWLKFAKYLPEFGWEPIILTVDPKFASYPQRDESLLEQAKSIKTFKTKSFEINNLYSSLKKDKQIPYGGFSNENKPNIIQKVSRFIRGNFFLPDSRKAWNRFAYKEALKIINNNSIKYIVTTSPPHSTQLIGLKLKQKLNNIFWISDLRDPWTDIYYYNKFYPTKLARKIDNRLEKKVVINSDRLITVSNSIKELLAARYDVNKKISVITNGFDDADFNDELFSNTKKNDEIVYTGTITNDYPIKEVIELSKNNPNLKFRFIGNATKEFKDLVKQENLSNNFKFDNAIGHNHIVKEMVNAGLLLLLIPKVLQNEGILTGKLFEYIGSRTPIIAIGPEFGDAEKIIKKVNCGVYYSYNMVRTIREKEFESLINITINSNYVNYSRKKLTYKLSTLLNNLTND